MRDWLLKLLLTAVLSLSGILAATNSFAAGAAFKEWAGEYFDQREGGFYLKTQLKGFKASQQTSFMTGNIQIKLFSILRKKEYLLTHRISAIRGYPAELWKAPSGKYIIRSVSMVDTSGKIRTWQGTRKNMKTLIIKRQILSNFGLWTITPRGANGLKVKFAMVGNSYKENSTKSESSVAAVINGFNGVVQEKFAGKKIQKKAEENYDRLGSVTVTRQIEMYYALNLFKHNYRAQSIADVLKVYEPNMRKCYTDRLRKDDNLKGTAKYLFILSKVTGTMAKLKNSGGTAARDAKLVSCLFYEMGHIQFPVPETMIGELTYTFGVVY